MTGPRDIRGSSSSARSGVRLTAVRGHAPEKRRGILVLESEGSCLSAWLTALADLGAPVASARDESAARASSGFAVVVVGTMPTGQCPIALARDLGARSADDRPRIVLVSRDEVRRVDRVHVDAVITRPVRIDVLVGHVRRLLALSERTTPRVRREPSRRPA